MKRLSSRVTLIYKWVLPAAWLLALLVAAAFAAFNGHWPDNLPTFGLVMVLAASSYFAFDRMFWDMADLVWDRGDRLLVKHHGIQSVVVLSNIEAVTGLRLGRLRRVTLQLGQPVDGRKSLVFMTPRPLNPYAADRVREDLEQRARDAREREASPRSGA